jgi:sodium/proline symporter
MVFIEMVKDLFHPFIVGFILCGIIAANMSTMDSQILVCSSIISRDLYKYISKDQMSDKKVLLISKASVIVVSLVALLLASNKSSTIANTVSYSWSGLGSAFGPLVLMSLYSKNTTRYGALAGIVIGTLVSMFWPSIKPLLTSYDVMPIIPGFMCSLVSIYVVSKLTDKRTDLTLKGSEHYSSPLA